MPDSLQVQNIIQGLRALQEEPLSIIRLSEPISASATSHRTSDASEAAFDNPSPASLEADLTHYKVFTSFYFVQEGLLTNMLRNSSPNSASPTSNK